MPRPSHSKKDPDAAEAFKNSVAEKLEALKIEAGSQVKVWFMDEARFGLHTDLRRVWTIKGTRPIVTRQIKYQWDYLYGALGAVGGDVHFMRVPGVSLEWDGAYLETLAASDPDGGACGRAGSGWVPFARWRRQAAGAGSDHRPAALQPGTQPL